MPYLIRVCYQIAALRRNLPKGPAVLFVSLIYLSGAHCLLRIIVSQIDLIYLFFSPVDLSLKKKGLLGTDEDTNMTTYAVEAS